MDSSLPENAGLDIVVERLNRMSRALGLNKIASKADFYALAATVAAEVGFEEAAKTNALCASPISCIPVKWGRIDEENCSFGNTSAQ